MKFIREFTMPRTQERFSVEIEVNIEEVAQALAARAIQSKSGKAVALGGDIKCKVISRKAATA
jgi:hypothetical protein